MKGKIYGLGDLPSLSSRQKTTVKKNGDIVRYWAWEDRHGREWEQLLNGRFRLKPPPNDVIAKSQAPTPKTRRTLTEYDIDQNFETPPDGLLEDTLALVVVLVGLGFVFYAGYFTAVLKAKHRNQNKRHRYRWPSEVRTI
jgi:hypothetical protein